jgi:hypothetical protein
VRLDLVPLRYGQGVRLRLFGWIYLRESTRVLVGRSGVILSDIDPQSWYKPLANPSVSIAQLVGAAAEANRLVAAADINTLWQYGQPNAGASNEVLRQVEVRYDFVPEYVEFLRVANGWRGFYHDVDLLSGEELGGGSRLDRAWMLAESADQGSGGALALSKSTYIPIGVATEDIDVFLLDLLVGKGQVRWIAGYDIETFPSIADFLRGVTLYNQQTLRDLRDDPWLGAG